MERKIGVEIHNKFDFEVYDAATGELKQKAVAYNLILNSMYSRLVNGQDFCNAISVGTGTGTLDPARTALFQYLTYKTSTIAETIRSYPVSSGKFTITLNPEECIGSVITEVAIGYNSTPYTHALLQDSEGNTISITKTATDVIKIYATVYATFSLPEGACMPKVASGSNTLVEYLINRYSYTSPSTSFIYGPSDAKADYRLYTALAAKTYTGSANTPTNAADIANKRRTFSSRFPISSTACNIKEIALDPVVRYTLPIAGVFAGQPYTGVPVATGDGTTRSFLVPSQNIDDDSLVLRVDGVVTNVIKKRVNKAVPNFEISMPMAYPTNQNSNGGMCFSRNGLVLAGMSFINSPALVVFDVIDSTLVTRYWTTQNSATGVYGLYDVALSANGDVMAVADTTSKVVHVFDWNGTTYIERSALPPSLPYRCYRVALSDNGNILACSFDGSPCVRVYDWSGTEWVARANIPEVPTGNSGICSLSGTGNTVCINDSYSPYIRVFDWNGSAWIKRSNPTWPATGGGIKDAKLSIDGNILAIGINVTPYFAVYDWVDSAWVKRANPVVLPAGESQRICLSNNGNTFSMAHSGTPYCSMYDWSGSEWIKRDTQAMAVDTVPMAIATNDNLLFVHGANSSSRFYGFDVSARHTLCTFDAPVSNGAVITADYTVLGIHKTDQYVIDISVIIQFGEVT